MNQSQLTIKRTLPALLAIVVGLFTIAGIAYFFNNIVGDRYASTGDRAPDATQEYLIDADTANEIDDLFAIVGAIAQDDRGETGPVLAGITAAQFHTSPLASATSADESQALNERIVRLMGRPALRTLVGSNRPLADAKTPNRSPAATFILERASLASKQNKLQIFVLGPCTNVASALLLNPKIAEVIHVRYLGFWYNAETGVYDKKEFNTGNDSIALNLLLNNPKLEFTVMTATTSEALQMSRADLNERLPQGHPVTKMLQRRWDTFDRWWTDEDANKQHWTMWDVASLEAWFEPDLATLSELPAPADNLDRNIKVYTAIDSAAMLDRYFSVVSDYLETVE
ncbi:nucleoside hydrolase [Lewinella sp. 4G2]|uniref:nucleoside hydrolase n=1 Tax=Lewinella sp. 4G2 TaxID=1803372 RepID=UPI0007B46213|nr:nucleoside hydrolase [Lewinella sp. 4G2]OAV44798.1 hypothetical protein A3850_009990 [Lewinella sp. 4G2]